MPVNWQFGENLVWHSDVRHKRLLSLAVPQESPPRLNAGRKNFICAEGMIRIPENSAPDIKNKSCG